ncbi:hypothetical protein PR202_gb28769 [Eleusine coracana subsp. coracana]|uniref:MATH domain-containing protein n=1 Tax=Eleusine coracana subsp. coracana TaxID=191504 RepID=A0AAV5FXW0_ELECO|nr:hypothetical protein QOZ80_8BG0645370 [Eleusine coracana subsp. coracana]GJN39638.1 hypothetical protein PR202_gb28769 [Eleusine coracana subsp. coracana]
MSSSTMPPLLPPAGGMKPYSTSTGGARAAYAVVAKPARGFQIFRIDGYSWTTTLPAGECVTSDPFVVGGRTWQIDYYPNGADADASSDSSSAAVAVYLRFVSPTYQGGYEHYRPNERARAQFKFALLDASGSPAYELPAETAVFSPQAQAAQPEDLGCGHAAFVSREQLERHAQSLLADDRLVIRCDVGVMELEVVAVGPKQHKSHHHLPHGYGGRYATHARDGRYDDDDDEHSEGRRHKAQDETEFIRQCLTQRRRN